MKERHNAFLKGMWRGMEPMERGVRQLGLMGLAVATWEVCQQGLWISATTLGVLTLAGWFYMNWREPRSLRWMRRLAESLRQADCSLNFSPQGLSAGERMLVDDINASVRAFQARLTDLEERLHYSETLLQIVDSYLLVTDVQGRIPWMNRAAEHHLCGHRLHDLHELAVLQADLPEWLMRLQPGEVKVVRLCREERIQELAVTVTVYTPRSGSEVRLYNLRNIHAVLEAHELEAWQKLIRVLTHEMMNSLAPILSLSDTLCDRPLRSECVAKDYALMQQAMQTIHRRSQGLLDFVQNYRKLSRLPLPVLAPVPVAELLQDLRKLFPDEGIRHAFPAQLPAEVLWIDRGQIEQVLINLMKNAEEACREGLVSGAVSLQADSCPIPCISVEAEALPAQHLFVLRVRDTGSGMLPEVLDKIFVPFFTTKPHGSGVGLSLCKQIMALHRGSISVSSTWGEGSCFTLRFPM